MIGFYFQNTGQDQAQTIGKAFGIYEMALLLNLLWIVHLEDRRQLCHLLRPRGWNEDRAEVEPRDRSARICRLQTSQSNLANNR